MEPFIGEIKMVGFNFAPIGYARCDGQLLPISQNEALFFLIGTTYGGDGQQTFALPDFRGRIPIHQGQGPGLSPRQLGEVLGEEHTTLLAQQLPSHNHPVGQLSLPCSVEDAVSGSPAGAYLAVPSGPGGIVNAYRTASSPGKFLGGTGSGGNIQPAGGSQPHPNLQPYLAVNFIIALEGIFPSRN